MVSDTTNANAIARLAEVEDHNHKVRVTKIDKILLIGIIFSWILKLCKFRKFVLPASVVRESPSAGASELGDF